MKPLLLLLCALLLLSSCAPQRLTGTPFPPEAPPPPLSADASVLPEAPQPIPADPLPEALAKPLYLGGRQIEKAFRKESTLYVRAEAIGELLGAGLQTGEDRSLTLTLPEAPPLSFVADGKDPACLYTEEEGFLLSCELLSSFGYRTLESEREILFTRVSDPAALPQGVKVPVLMYHAVSNDCWGIRELFVSPERMEEQLQWLLQEGYTPILFEELAEADRIEKPILLTFDDGYDDNYLHLFPLLQKYKVKANVFVITENVGREHFLTREQIQAMDESGLVSFQSHTATHPYLDELNEEALRAEFSRSQSYLRELLHKEPFVLCYPSGRHSSLARSVARDYYSFGLLMSGGRSYSTSDDPFLVRRDYVARSTTLSQLKEMLKS